jgi:hypothetical protein
VLLHARCCPGVELASTPAFPLSRMLRGRAAAKGEMELKGGVGSLSSWRNLWRKLTGIFSGNEARPGSDWDKVCHLPPQVRRASDQGVGAGNLMTQVTVWTRTARSEAWGPGLGIAMP